MITQGRRSIWQSLKRLSDSRRNANGTESRKRSRLKKIDRLRSRQSVNDERRNDKRKKKLKHLSNS